MRRYRIRVEKGMYIDVKIADDRGSMLREDARIRTERRIPGGGSRTFNARFYPLVRGNSLGIVLFNRQSFYLSTIIHEAFHAHSQWMRRVGQKVFRGKKAVVVQVGEERAAYMMEKIVTRMFRAFRGVLVSGNRGVE